jgi:hypothetical protein
MSNWGIGANAFADGLIKGMGIGRAIKKVRQDREVESAISSGLDSAKSDQQGYVDTAVKTTDGSAASQYGLDLTQAPAGDAMTAMLNKPANPLPEGVEGPANPVFKVGDQQFSTQAEAKTAAAKKAPDQMSIFREKYAPKVYETYLKQGRLEDAEAFSKWSKTKEAEEITKSYGGVLKATMSGDPDRMIEAIASHYKYVDDGLDVLPEYKTVIGQDGSTTYNIQLKNKKSGKIFEMPMNAETITAIGETMGAPDKIWESNRATQAERAKEKRKFQLETAMEKNKSALRSQEKQFEKGLDVQGYGAKKNIDTEAYGDRKQIDAAAEQQAITDAESRLRKIGVSEDAIKTGITQKLLGKLTGDTRQQRHPEDAAQDIWKELNNDPMFKMKPIQEQQQMVKDVMQGLSEVAGGKAKADAGRPPPAAPSGGLTLWP